MADLQLLSMDIDDADASIMARIDITNLNRWQLSTFTRSCLVVRQQEGLNEKQLNLRWTSLSQSIRISRMQVLMSFCLSMHVCRCMGNARNFLSNAMDSRYKYIKIANTSKLGKC